MKKIAAILLCILMATSYAMAEDIYMPPHKNPGQYPYKDAGDALTYLMPISSSATNFISSYAENPAYQQIQEDTGISIDFIHPAAGKFSAEFQAMCKSGDLPDIIQLPSASLYKGGLEKMYEDGLIIDLSPYVKNLAPQYLSVVHYDPISVQQVYEGKNREIFGFYRIDHSEAVPFVRFNCRKDWLEEFNMQEPTTVAEYEAYFDAVLKYKPGVTPLYLNFKNAASTNLLMGCFGLLRDFYQVDGEVRYYANAEEYHDFLKLMNDWYQKGYLDKDFQSISDAKAQEMFDNGTLAMYPSSVDSTYIRTKESDIEVTNCPYMRFKTDSILGSEISSFPVSQDLAYVSVITTSCKDIEAAVSLLNYMYTYEGSLIGNWGVEGLTYEMGANGLPEFTEYYTNNPNGMTTSNASYVLRIHFGSKNTYNSLICGLVGDDAINNRTKWSNDPNVNSSLRLPLIQLTSEMKEKRDTIISSVEKYAWEMMVQFIQGTESLDNWSSYIEKVNELGLPEAILITQAAYPQP